MKQMGFWPDDLLRDLIKYWRDTEADDYGLVDFLCRRLTWSPQWVHDWMDTGKYPQIWLDGYWARVTRATPRSGETS